MNIPTPPRPIEVEASYDQLVRVLGQPGPGTADGKTRVEWTVRTLDGEVHVYDWKKTAPVDQVFYWNINAPTQPAAELVKGGDPAVLPRLGRENPIIFRTSDELRTVHPHVFAATAQLAHAFYRSGHDRDHIREVIATHGAEDVVAVLVQQLDTAIHSPAYGTPEWADDEIERSEDAMQTDAELERAERNAELADLGVPAQYRARLRAGLAAPRSTRS